MRFRSWVALAVLLVGTLNADPASAIGIGLTDTFEDGTTQGWFAGAPHPAPPTNIATGGPAGVDDNFLLLTSLGGLGPGSRMAVINESQWTGNYTAAGVNAITMDLKNLGSTDLYIRLLFGDPLGGANVAMTNAFFLPAGGSWVSTMFLIHAGALTALRGDVNAVLSNTTALRLFHNQLAGFPPPSIVAQFGVDNIQASNIPEPSTLLLCGAGIVARFLRGRRRRSGVTSTAA